MKRLLPLFLLLACSLSYAQELPRPDTTLCFAHRDTCDLLLDFYAAAPGAGPCADSLRKPVIVHVFGGGFMMGQRNHPTDLDWYRQLADAGWNVVTIDYRLGLKGAEVKMNRATLDLFVNAIQMAVDDLFAATDYLLGHADELAIDPDRIIVSGSSAGAITALQAEWEICNGKEPAQVLPPWFNYAGVMSFSGAILSTDGPVSFPQKPCPILLLHGTEDQIVTYNSISLFRYQFAGSNALAKKLATAGANFQILRFKGAGHEVAASMLHNLPEELRFLEENVIKGARRQVDALIEDDGIPEFAWARLRTRDIYK